MWEHTQHIPSHTLLNIHYTHTHIYTHRHLPTCTHTQNIPYSHLPTQNMDWIFLFTFTDTNGLKKCQIGEFYVQAEWNQTSVEMNLSVFTDLNVLFCCCFYCHVFTSLYNLCISSAVCILIVVVFCSNLLSLRMEWKYLLWMSHSEFSWFLLICLTLSLQAAAVTHVHLHITVRLKKPFVPHRLQRLQSKD